MILTGYLESLKPPYLSMVLKLENISSTVDVATYRKGTSPYHKRASKYEVEIRNVMMTRESELLNRTSTRTTDNKNSRNGKRTVTFSSKIDVFEVERPTIVEKLDMHMSKADQQAILREISSTIRQLAFENQFQGVYDDERNNALLEELCLKRIIDQQGPERINRIKSALCVILRRQKQHRLSNSSEKETLTINEAWLEKHYRPYSKVSANLARGRGLRDQEVAPFLCPRKNVMSR